VSCAKTAEPIEMEFGMLSRVGPVNMYYMGNVNAAMGSGAFGVSGRLKGVVKRTGF